MEHAPNAKNKAKATEVVGMRFTKQQVQQLDELAHESYRSRTAYLRWIIGQHLARNRSKRAKHAND